MGTRITLIGIIACAMATSSCASVARDAVVDAYEGAALDESRARACQIDAKTLATASEAFYAANGVSAQSFDDLVPSYIQAAPTNWVVPEGEPGIVSNLFSPRAGGPCDGVDLSAPTHDDDSIGRIGVDAITDSRAVNCTYDQRALDVAIETYFVLNEMNPSSIDELNEFGLIEDQAERWTVSASETPGAPSVASPVPGGSCDG